MIIIAACTVRGPVLTLVSISARLWFESWSSQLGTLSGNPRLDLWTWFLVCFCSSPAAPNTSMIFFSTSGFCKVDFILGFFYSFSICSLLAWTWPWRCLKHISLVQSQLGNTWFIPLISCCCRAMERPLGMGVCAGGQFREQRCFRQREESEDVLIHL